MIINTYGGTFFMKKALAIIMTVCVLVSVSMFSSSASGDAIQPTAPTNSPDWVITEIMPDQGACVVAGCTTANDAMEFLELYNNSATPLNLYDYCMTYNGNARTTTDLFEREIVEITPFKPGDYTDGTTAPATYVNKPSNPATCMVDPGEIVVVWFVTTDSSNARYDGGNGLSVAHFREQWSIPENVKVICIDGNSADAEKNFNAKNSATGTYGIALYSEALNTAANVAGSTFPVVYTESPELICWATVDFTPGRLPIASPNNSSGFNFTVDKQGVGAAEFGDVPDARRMMMIESYMVPPSAGYLTPLQKLTLGIALDAGDMVVVDDCYYPELTNLTFAGFEINGTLYAPKSTFTAAAAGICSFSYKYIDSASTTAPAVTTKAPSSTTKAPTTTKTPATTAAPGTNAAPATTATPTTTAPIAGDKKGCGSLIGFGLIASLIPAAIIITRKKHE